MLLLLENPDYNNISWQMMKERERMNPMWAKHFAISPHVEDFCNVLHNE